MNAPTFLPIDDHGWDVPDHEVALYGARQHRYALVIPVINEGDRIRGQLLRIQAAALAVDVVVADGGSTDGSLDPGFVESVGVRAVLTKTGPGKLSAQLRVAYAWCLRQGYDGIVTIDGNGKDGVERVTDMVAKLARGYDYVQGSRYLPGGQAENTPFERTIANRLIHAPLLSIAGRHVFTDTTNGFRAYSSRYLLHPDVRPFRDEFQVYGLLFYLTVRAGQLGLKVGHVPVVRRYPDSGKVPTKIGGFASKLALLGETVFAATGGHTPDRVATRMPSLGWAALVALLVTLPLFLSAVVAPAYTPDSWALYELSRTVFDDFYRFTHFRSYGEDAAYSSAFPPLFPMLVAAVDGVLGSGARTGLYLAYAAFVGFAVLSEAIGRRVSGTAWIGLVCALLLLLGPKMLVVELDAGRTIPLQLCLYAIVLIGLLKAPGITLAGAAVIGFVSGLAVLNRFDAALLPFLTAAAIWWLTRMPLRAFVALAASIVAIAPWIAYSLATFGVVFASDNSGVVMALDPRAFVTDWWPVAKPTLADDPIVWSAKLAGNIGGFVNSAAALLFSPMGLVFAAAMAICAGLHGVAARRSNHPSASGLRGPKELGIVALFAGMLALAMAPQLLAGYLEYRYYSALFWAIFLLGSCWAVGCAATAGQKRVFRRLILLIWAPVIALFSLAQLFPPAKGEHSEPASWSAFDAPEPLARLQHCLRPDPQARVLVIGDDVFAAQAGALGGVRAMMEPRNMAEGRLSTAGAKQFLSQWRVGYVLVLDPVRERSAVDELGLAPVAECSLPLFAARAAISSP